MIYVCNMDVYWQTPINIIDKYQTLEEFCESERYNVYNPDKVGYSYWNHTDEGRIRIFNTEAKKSQLPTQFEEAIKELDRENKLKGLLDI